jgi:DNA-binding transcriptional LysR family regulator
MIPAIISGDVEFGISSWSTPHPETVVEKLFNEPFVLVFPSKHVLARKKQVKWKDVADHKMIRVGRLNGREFVNQLPITSMTHWSYEVQHSFSTGLAMVEATLGMMVVPNLVFRQDKFPSLTSRPLIAPSLFRPICIVRRKGTTPSPPAEEFLKLVKRHLTS